MIAAKAPAAGLLAAALVTGCTTVQPAAPRATPASAAAGVRAAAAFVSTRPAPPTQAAGVSRLTTMGKPAPHQEHHAAVHRPHQRVAAADRHVRQLTGAAGGRHYRWRPRPALQRPHHRARPRWAPAPVRISRRRTAPTSQMRNLCARADHVIPQAASLCHSAYGR
ncbi:hypothetical protein [Streptomyces fuscigenes]|uniref:hypothetical protein n=1 Tax=Streptomyces fuscigenes TaxID=1528880 RepID=UPI001F447AA1|nr:hypothetical protein [Streptomyces fuscigenes]MCF3960457.1 hypothetical protein [Streptomyces fuscigenes]